MEIMSSKDVEGLLQSMIEDIGIWKSRPELDHNRIYYVLQGPTYWINKFYHANVNRTKIAIRCIPHDPDATSWVYFSNYPEYPNAFRMNVHYKSLLMIKQKQEDNLLGAKIYPIPDISKIDIENTLNTPYEEPNKDLSKYLLKNGY